MTRRLVVARRRDPRNALQSLPPRYAIERELGRGGMAVVYLARDRQLDRDVAIKVLHSTLLANRNSVARLTQEARVVAQLQHPHIVAIYDLERLRDGSVALIMQYVRGRSLRSIIDADGQLPIPFVGRVLSEVASGLGAAHRRGIVHRDVKPENIYLEQESGRALLADFGIARAPRLAEGLTPAGEALGTPHYMSPEQITGGELDGRSDLYSLGLVGYEMLTGEQPWSGKTLYHVLHKQQHEYLPSLRHSRSDLPIPLEDALKRVLRKERLNRPETAESFLSLLSAGSPDAAADREEGGGRARSVVQPRTDLAALDAPTVRYNRSRPTSDGPAKRSEAPESPAAAPPFWLDPPQQEATGRSRDAYAAVAPAVATPPPAPAGPTGATGAPEIPIDPLAQLSATLRVKASTNAPVQTRRRGWASTSARRAVGITAVSASAGFLVVLFGLLTGSGDSNVGAAPSPPDDSAAVGSPPQPAANPPPGGSAASSSRPAPSGGGRSSASSTVARDRYQSAGDITDIFCRPYGEETVEQWRNRVPSYCTLTP